MKFRPAPFKLGGIGPADVCSPQSCREEILGENEALPDFWPDTAILGEEGQAVSSPDVPLFYGCGLLRAGVIIELVS